MARVDSYQGRRGGPMERAREQSIRGVEGITTAFVRALTPIVAQMSNSIEQSNSRMLSGTMAQLMSRPAPSGSGGPFGAAPQEFASIITRITDPIDRFGKGMKKVGKRLKSFTARLGRVAAGGFSFLMTVLDKLGILEPIMAILAPIFEIIGGSVMEALMPALQVLIDVVTDPVFTDMLMQIGTIIGEILSPIIEIFAEILMMLMPVILPLIKVLAAVLIPIIDAFRPVLGALAPIFELLGKALEYIAPLVEIVAGVIGVVLAGAFIVMVNAIIFMINKILDAIQLVSLGIINIKRLKYVDLPTYDYGGIAKTDQIARVQKGEMMIPLKDQKDMLGGKGDVNITIEGNVYRQDIIDEMLSELKTRKALRLI